MLKRAGGIAGLYFASRLALQLKPIPADRLAMASFGGYLMVFGALSGVLSFFNYEFSLLMWIDAWGDAVAWFIRGGLILLGLSLVTIEKRKVESTQQPDPISQEMIR